MLHSSHLDILADAIYSAAAAVACFCWVWKNSIWKKFNFKFRTFDISDRKTLVIHIGIHIIVYTRGSQPVVRVPLVVREKWVGGTQKLFWTKTW